MARKKKDNKQKGVSKDEMIEQMRNSLLKMYTEKDLPEDNNEKFNWFVNLIAFTMVELRLQTDYFNSEFICSNSTHILLDYIGITDEGVLPLTVQMYKDLWDELGIDYKPYKGY